MAIDYEALGKRISNARKQIGITQEALGEQLNMTRKTHQCYRNCYQPSQPGYPG